VNLIVAEKRSVAQAIAKFLGKYYKPISLYGVKAYRFEYEGESISIGLGGHLMDFDFDVELNTWHRVEPGVLFSQRPLLIVRDESAKYALALKSLAKKADVVYLALDADSEGEAIAYESYLLIRYVNPKAKFFRVKFNAVTKKDIESAFKRPAQLDLRTVEKVFTRMQLDLIIGAVFTRLFTLSMRKYSDKLLSYGPCQTPVLGLVVSRELERQNFKPQQYFIIKAKIKIDNSIIIMYSDKYEDFNKIKNDINKIRSGRVINAVYNAVDITPPAPLDTLELERRASRWLGIKSKAAMAIAEELYRMGYISYPRTETTIYPATLDLREVLKELLKTRYRDYVSTLLNAPLKPTRGRTDDGAHPPIYPVKGADYAEIARKFGRRANVAWKLYDLVVRHFLATLSKPARVERQKIVVDFSGVVLKAEGISIIDPGYWRIYPYEEVEERALPKVDEGAIAVVVEARAERRETKPPPRMTESELLALMKKYGIGTDATMQDHIHTNIARGYMVIEKRKCIPTKLGMAFANALFRHAPQLIDPNIRAKMEKILQSIIKNEIEPIKLIELVKQEYNQYYKLLLNKKSNIVEELRKALIK